MASQPDSAIQEFSNSYSNAGQTGKDAYLKSMNIKDGDLPNGLMNVVNKVSESMQNQMANAGFVERGKEIMNKVDEGVKAGQDTIKASVKEVVETGVTGGITDGAESVKTGAQEVTLRYRHRLRRSGGNHLNRHYPPFFNLHNWFSF